MSKLKEYIKKLKEAWKDPRKKAGIKLLGYFIFFVILLLLAAITSRIESTKTHNNNNRITTTTTQKVDNYGEKQNNILSEKYNINYVINVNNKEYKINGTLDNKIIEGYLETEEDIKKITVKDNNIYEIKNNTENILETDINNDLINVEHIIKLIKATNVLKEEKDSFKIYKYNLEQLNLNIEITANEEMISKILITNENNFYEMNFDK